MSDRVVSQERSGWRDLGLSERHRQWGWDCPAHDVDFNEYDGGVSKALVEYKHECADPCYPQSANVRALVNLGNRAGVPVFGVRYASDYSWFKVKALNQLAFKWVGSGIKEMSEFQWVTLLYKIRGRTIPPTIVQACFPNRPAAP